MALIDKLTNIADAIRGKTGKTEEMTLDQMATEIAGIQAVGGGSDAVELLYETVANLETSITTNTQTDIAVINTGFTGQENEPQPGDSLLVVITCENDTDPDASYNHFKARTQTAAINSDKLGSVTQESGTIYNAASIVSGVAYGVFVVASAKNLATIKLRAKGNATYGFAPSGSYRVKILRISHKATGLEEFV